MFITTVVLFCRWFHLSVRHASARGVGLGITPAGAVGSWFIPFVNLARPFDLSRRMLAGTGADSSVVGPWQALWIVGNVASNLSARVDNAALSLVSSLLLVGAAIAGVRVINAVTASAGGDVG